jgi:DNA repair exonuclease SbcCD ATPase subunit
MQKDVVKFKQLHEELKIRYDDLMEEYNKYQDTQDNLQTLNEELERNLDSRDKEIADISKKLQASEKERVAQAKDIQEINEQLAHVEEINAELLKQIEQEREQTLGIEASVEQYEDELQEKEQALEKAQNLIKKLNDECERMVKDLKKYETFNENLKKENRNLEKMYNDVRKKMTEVDGLKRTEERLREESSSLKMKIQELNTSKQNETTELSHTIGSLLEEKTHLEAVIEELEEKLKEIEKQSDEREELFKKTYDRLQDVETTLLQREEFIKILQEAHEQSVTIKDEEITHLKRQAENVIRNLQVLQAQDEGSQSALSYRKLNKTPLKPAKLTNPKKRSALKVTAYDQLNKENTPENTDELEAAHKLLENLVVSPATVESLAEQLEKALLREANLKIYIKKFVEEEAKYIKERLKNAEHNVSVLRPEVERWIMRNEELETRMVEMSERNQRLIRVVKDYQKAIIIKNKQIKDNEEYFDNIRKDLIHTIDILKSELAYDRDIYAREIIPEGINTINNALSISHSKILELSKQISELNLQLQDTQLKVDQKEEMLRYRDDDLRYVKNEFIRVKNDLWHIERELESEPRRASLNPVSLDNPAPHFFDTFRKQHYTKDASLREIEDLDNITPTARKVLEDIQELKDYKEALMHERETREHLLKEIDRLEHANSETKEALEEKLNELQEALKDRERGWNEEYLRLHEEIKDMKDCQMSAEDKNRIIYKLEQELYSLKGQNKDLMQRLNENSADCDVLERQLKETRNQLDKVLLQVEESKVKYNRDVDQLKYEISEKSRELLDARARINRFEAESIVKSTEIDRSTMRLSELEKFKTDRRMELEAKDSIIRDLQRELDYLKKSSAVLSEAFSSRYTPAKSDSLKYSSSDNTKSLLSKLEEENYELCKENTRLKKAYENLLADKKMLDEELARERLPKVHTRARTDFKGYEESASQEAMLKDTPYIKRLEELLEEKNQQLITLKRQLEINQEATFKSPKSVPLQPIGHDTFRLNKDSRNHEETIQDLEKEIERLSRKKESDKKSFQKRVKEFELILRYLEEKIMSCTEASHRPITSDKMQNLIKDLASKNPSLNAWLNAICNKLDTLSLEKVDKMGKIVF